eukprot:2499185-Pyramimonas_sp.AAC.1
MRLTSSIPALGNHMAYQLRDLGYVYVEALEVLGIEVSGRPVRYSRLRQRVRGVASRRPRFISLHRAGPLPSRLHRLALPPALTYGLG